MKKISFLLLSVLLFTFSACKKKNNPPSIVAKWAMTDISGTVIDNYSSFYQQTTTLTYNSSINTLTISSTSAGGTDISTVMISTENWEFKADGTYTINETYTVDSGPAETATSSGTWAFLSNTRANNSIVLLGPSSEILSNATNSGGAYNIELIADKLVLKVNDAQTSSSGGTQSTNITITFKRQ